MIEKGQEFEIWEYHIGKKLSVVAISDQYVDPDWYDSNYKPFPLVDIRFENGEKWTAICGEDGTWETCEI